MLSNVKMEKFNDVLEDKRSGGEVVSVPKYHTMKVQNLWKSCSY